MGEENTLTSSSTICITLGGGFTKNSIPLKPSLSIMFFIVKKKLCFQYCKFFCVIVTKNIFCLACGERSYICNSLPLFLIHSIKKRIILTHQIKIF
jgi:hypothetical protein